MTGMSKKVIGRTATFAALALIGTLGLVGSAACSRQVRVESGPADSAQGDTVSGTVRQVGNSPFIRTVVQSDERSVQVVGPYEDEIAHLVGARVSVVGEMEEGSEGQAMGPRLRASGYQVLSVDGDRPQVGYLRQSDGGDFFLRTEDGDRVPLTTVSSTLAEKVGAKVWVVTNDRGAVTRYGILREPT